LIQFSTLEDVLQVLRDSSSSLVEERSYSILRCPDVLILVEHLHTLRLIFCLEDQELRCRITYLELFTHLPTLFSFFCPLRRMPSDINFHLFAAFHAAKVQNFSHMCKFMYDFLQAAWFSFGLVNLFQV
jgi:hypothetical protein